MPIGIMGNWRIGEHNKDRECEIRVCILCRASQSTGIEIDIYCNINTHSQHREQAAQPLRQGLDRLLLALHIFWVYNRRWRGGRWRRRRLLLLLFLVRWRARSIRRLGARQQRSASAEQQLLLILLIPVITARDIGVINRSISLTSSADQAGEAGEEATGTRRHLINQAAMRRSKCYRRSQTQTRRNGGWVIGASYAWANAICRWSCLVRRTHHVLEKRYGCDAQPTDDGKAA